MNWAWLFLSFEGRIGRGCYALGHLILGLVGSALAAFHVGAAPAALLLAAPSLALIAKRLHDLGLSMALAVIPLAAVATIVALTWDHGPRMRYVIEGAPQRGDAPVLCLAAVALLFGLWMASARGDSRPNTYGERAR